MLTFLKDLITQLDIPTIVSYAIFALVATLLFYLFFYFAKKRNLQVYTTVVFFVILALFVMAFFIKAKQLSFYLYFALVMLTVTSVMLFLQDLNRNIFRLSLKRKTRREALPTHYGSEDLSKSINEITKACLRMSKTDTGALIVFADHMSDEILDSGIRVNGEITAELLESLFFPKTPLHDGAVIIMANKVVAAGCYLPLTQAQNLPREFGTRHRAAIGVAGAFPDATAIVVSEETGIISAVHDYHIKRYLDTKQLQEILECAMDLKDDSVEEKIWGEDRK